MKPLTKFDVLLYIWQTKPANKTELINTIRKNVFFEKTKDRIINLRLKELKRENLVIWLKINKENPKFYNYLAFVYWSKLRGRDYNILVNNNVKLIFEAIFHNHATIEELTEKTRLSKPTILKTIKILAERNFIDIIKRKPIVVKANLNDLTFFYANIFDLDFSKYESRFSAPDVKKVHSRKLIKKLIQLHTYSTTVTEGNTATLDSVERVFDNYAVNLTPKEINEIINTKKAIELIYANKKESITADKIKQIHKILMYNLLEKPGEFYYYQKKIVRSRFKLPSSKEESDSSVFAMLDFYKKNEKRINPFFLSAIVHFIYVSIHPFSDGNGRIARLLHSWILIKSDLPLFVFDPNNKNRYFDCLEEAREKRIDKFVDFCSEEQGNVSLNYM